MKQKKMLPINRVLIYWIYFCYQEKTQNNVKMQCNNCTNQQNRCLLYYQLLCATYNCIVGILYPIKFRRCIYVEIDNYRVFWKLQPPQEMRIYIFPTKSYKTALFIYSTVDQNLTGKNIFQSSCVSTHYFWCIEAIDCLNPTPNTLTIHQNVECINLR